MATEGRPKRTFFVLAHDAHREDLEVVAGHDMGSFDPRTFWTGQRFAGVVPYCVKIWVSPGRPSDYLGNAFSWEIVSERFMAYFEKYAATDIQALDVPLVYEHTEAPVTGYRLLNVVRCLDAVAVVDGKKDVNLQGLILDGDAIPPDVHVFRLSESKTTCLVSGEFLEGITGRGLQGVALIKTTTLS
jgi:hypothetical protein